MNQRVFQQWLLQKRGLTAKATSDAASRCRRIEAILGHKLEKAAVSQASFDNALTIFRRAFPHRSDLMYAIRLHVTFQNPNIDSKKYPFHGQLNEIQKSFISAK